MHTLTGNPAISGLAVDGFIDPGDLDATILGVEENENDLLEYCQLNAINYLVLSSMEYMDWSDDEGSLASPGVNVLAAFILKAKSRYGILQIGASCFGDDEPIQDIIEYNSNRSEPQEVIDVISISTVWNAGDNLFTDYKDSLILAYNNCISNNMLCEITIVGYNGLSLSDAGLGYVAPPAVVFTGGGGAGATAVATLAIDGSITRITLTNPGTGYTSAPTISFDGVCDVDAVATAYVSEDGLIRDELWQLAPYIHRALLYSGVSGAGVAYANTRDRQIAFAKNKNTQILILFGTTTMGDYYAQPRSLLEDWFAYSEDYNAEELSLIRTYSEPIGKIIAYQSTIREIETAPLTATVPVEYYSFTVTSKESDSPKRVKAVWETIEEHSNVLFVLERSTDYTTWTSVGQVNGAGAETDNFNILTSYALSDYHYIPGTSFYRLKQISADDSFTYSQIVSIRM